MTRYFKILSMFLLAMGTLFTACNKDDDSVDYTEYYGWRDQNNLYAANCLKDIRLGKGYFTDTVASINEPWVYYSTMYRVLRSANEDSLRKINRWITPLYSSTVKTHYTLFDSESVMERFDEYGVINDESSRNSAEVMNKIFGIGYSVLDKEYAIKADTLESKQVEFFSCSPSGVIPGWGDALQHMHIGDSWLICVPWYLAYGQKGSSDIDPYSNLFFKLELVDITDWGATIPSANN